MTRLVARALACRRGERLLFEGVAFELDAGGLLRLGGPNGSGKSSLLRLVAGLLPPAGGGLEWAGEPVAASDAFRRGLRFLGHQDAVKPVLTVRENLAAAAGLLAIERPALASALERLGLAALADLPVRFLSAGQRRRVSLARLALGPAPLWLLDEPTTNLDAGGVAAFLALLAEHRQAGGLALVATHEPLALEPSATLRLGPEARA
jgi:heme exporter protein A